MGRGEVVEFLNRNPTIWYTARQISEAVDIQISAVARTLRVMRKYGEVDYKETFIQHRKGCGAGYMMVYRKK